MKKLNNKGMSLLEVVLCFAIVSAVVIGMFNVIMTYETEEVSEAIRSDIIEYKNIVTKVLQDDIFRHELYNVERTKLNFICLSEEKWLQEKEKFIKDKNKKYEYIVEPSPKVNKNEKIVDKALDIFDKNTIEVK